MALNSPSLFLCVCVCGLERFPSCLCLWCVSVCVCLYHCMAWCYTLYRLVFRVVLFCYGNGLWSVYVCGCDGCFGCFGCLLPLILPGFSVQIIAWPQLCLGFWVCLWPLSVGMVKTRWPFQQKTSSSSSSSSPSNISRSILYDDVAIMFIHTSGR